MNKQRLERFVFVIGVFVGLLCVSAHGQLATQLPESIISAPQIGRSAQQEIDEYIQRWVDGLDSETFEQIKQSRDRLLSPFDSEDVSVAFRVAYGGSLIDVLAPLSGDDRDEVAINVIRILSEISTRNSLSVLMRRLEDDRPAVRFAALSGYKKTFEALGRGNTALTDNQSLEAIRDLSRAMQDETNAHVLEGYVLAFGAAAELGQSKSRVRDAALRAIVDGVGDKTRQDVNAGRLDQLLLRAGHIVRNVLIEVGGGGGQLSRDLLVGSGGLGGDMLMYIRREVESGLKTEQARQRAVLVVQVAETVVNLAHTQLNPSGARTIRLNEYLEDSEDDEFLRRVDEVIGDDGMLSKRPFEFPSDRFAG